jgi:hypothetical protein
MEPHVLFTWVILITLLYMGLVIIPGWKFRRAVRDVIKIFRNQGAACFGGTKKIEELGLGPRGGMETLFRTRDFKPYALQFLIKEEVIYVAPNEYLCLQEEKLSGFLEKYRFRLA